MDLNRNIQVKSQFWKGHLKKGIGRTEYVHRICKYFNWTVPFLCNTTVLGENFSWTKPAKRWQLSHFFLRTLKNTGSIIHFNLLEYKSYTIIFFYVNFPMQDTGKCNLHTSVVRADMTEQIKAFWQPKLWLPWGTPSGELQIEKKGEKRYSLSCIKA